MRFALLAAVLALAGCGKQDLVVCDGNSLTAAEYPEMLRAELGRGFKVVNRGIGSKTSGFLAGRATKDIDGLYRAGGVLVFWEITNDLFFGATKEEAYGRFRKYCEDRKSAGWRVIVLTVLPRSQENLPADFEASRQWCNEKIRREWGEYSDGLCDVADDKRIGFAGCENDTQYFTDKIHLTKEGYAVIASHVANSVRLIRRE